MSCGPCHRGGRRSPAGPKAPFPQRENGPLLETRRHRRSRRPAAGASHPGMMHLVVCGPSGTGKTFLLEALGQLAVEKGCTWPGAPWTTFADSSTGTADGAASNAIARIRSVMLRTGRQGTPTPGSGKHRPGPERRRCSRARFAGARHTRGPQHLSTVVVRTVQHPCHKWALLVAYTSLTLLGKSCRQINGANRDLTLHRGSTGSQLRAPRGMLQQRASGRRPLHWHAGRWRCAQQGSQRNFRIRFHAASLQRSW